MTLPGSEIRTRSSASSARSLASLELVPPTSNTSATCRPIRIEGLSARDGSWYTIDTLFARIWRSSESLRS